MNIFMDEHLGWAEKILLAEIVSLDNEQGCFASNAYLAAFLMVGESSIKKMIASLKEGGYIALESFDGRRRVLRGVKKSTAEVEKITPLAGQKASGRRGKNHTHINTVNNQDTSTAMPTGRGAVTMTKSPDQLALLDSFNAFWLNYPRKAAKKAAQKAWLKLSPDENLRQRIMLALDKAKTSKDWVKDNGQYVPYPATWLNGERWEDGEAAAEVRLPPVRWKNTGAPAVNPTQDDDFLC